jgi:nitrite reductase/ring-hydroxylating ferredoxin subunit
MLFSKPSKRHKLANDIAELPWQSNDMCLQTVDGTVITLVKSNDKIFACAHECPHAGGIFAEGYLDGKNNIICPVHDYKFSLENGRNVSGEGYQIKTYKVEVSAEGVFVLTEGKRLFGL